MWGGGGETGTKKGQKRETKRALSQTQQGSEEKGVAGGPGWEAHELKKFRGGEGQGASMCSEICTWMLRKPGGQCALGT